MGIKTKTVTECTCDVCGKDCDPSENRIRIKIDGGDGRDIGPSYIYGILHVEIPYRVAGGVVCKSCQVEWLTRYINVIRQQLSSNEENDVNVTLNEAD